MLQLVQVMCTISILLTQTLKSGSDHSIPSSQLMQTQRTRQSVLEYHAYTSCLHAITYFILEHILHLVFEKEIQLPDGS